ncbi:RNA polymerase sigma factor sigma-70 region 4 domain-containing protein [Tichowtungia aerotolerans]|uniref:Uncharacterized protein n=1 Tax=Tichowtungia aerotolerans TaxID=2697043 RepID=A0A6P1MDH7_9BACT|nr:sigma-70 region 4 domain-containing protein [Tichowtungia aerotolerans]QHI70128.1 hypothetical protein GT409_11965 [Tichowtungia aerotolerans]
MASLSKFTNPEVFRRFSPVLLAEFLGRSTEAVKARGIDLPSEPTEDNLPYDQIALLFLSADEALMGLYDAINLVNTLAANKGRGAILEAAKEKSVWVPCELSSPYDVALWTWLHYPDIAERAGYRLKMHNARSFYYFPSFLGEDTPALQYTPANIERFADTMGSFYAQASKGGVAKVLDVMEADELWLLIRHGGYLERRGDVDEESGEVSTICFRDEEYDVLIYNARHRELKIRRTTDATMERLKVEFGQIFFGSAHTFVGRESFPLSVLQQNDLSFFRTIKVPGIKSVRFSEVRYMLYGSVTKTVHEKSADLLQSASIDGYVVPKIAFHVDFAKLHFCFEGEDKYRSVDLYPPNRSSFARESDARKVEEWLREASLLNGGCNADMDERFFKALNIHLGESYTLNEWNLFFGDTFERADPFLQNIGKDASYWCAPGSAKRFDILREGEKVTALSPDYENSPEQERRNIDPAELRLFKLCPCSLSIRLNRSFGVENAFCSLEDGIYRMGTLRGPDRRRHRAFLLAHAERSTIALAKQTVGQEGEGIILVTPDYCPETVDFAVKNKILYVPLRDTLLPDFSLTQTFDESKKQFFALHAGSELLSQDQVTGFFAIAQALDENPRLKAPVHSVVFNLYCGQGMSSDEIARKCGCSKATVISRLERLKSKIGRPLTELRAYSDHFEKIAETLADDRASGYDARKAIYDDAAYQD